MSAEAVRPLREGFQQDPPRPEAPRPTYGGPAEPPPQVERQPRAAPPPEMEDPPPQESSDPFGAIKWPLVVKLLYKQIPNERGEMVDQLVFREPRGGDINRYGNPCRINRDGDVVIDERKMTYVMAALCGILPPMLENMDTRDWNSCAYRLRDFFLPDLRAWL